MSMRYGNGQEHDRAVPDEAYDELASNITNIAEIGDGPDFCSTPADYEWKYADKKKKLIPYNCGSLPATSSGELIERQFPHPESIRWEVHNVIIVEGTLRSGESNILARRCFYIDEESWVILLGEGYDSRGNVVSCYMLSMSENLGISPRGRWFSLFAKQNSPFSGRDSAC